MTEKGTISRPMGPPWAWTSLLAVGLIATVILSMGMGYLKISPLEVIKIIWSAITGNRALLEGMDKAYSFVVLEVRLPRILTSALVGAGLAVAGVIYQGILLNPLADPYTLGISAGAAFGASLALLMNITVLGMASVPLFAFGGAVLTLAVVLFLSSEKGGVSSNNLILSGIIVAAILSAGISFLKYIADEHVSVIIFWLMGSFVARTWGHVGITFTMVLLGFMLCFVYARELNILCLGDRSAISLGVRAQRVRLLLLVTASLITAVCVSVSGIIGFVGLIVPHLMRFLTGADNRALLPASALAGAILLCASDTVTRALLPTEMPIGVLTAIIGGPVFCYIFKKRRGMGAGYA